MIIPFSGNISKIIKKLNKILWGVLLVIIMLPTIVFFTLNSEYVQNKVTQQVTALLSEELGNHVSFDHVRLSWFNKLRLTHLSVTDLSGDTALYVPELIVRLNLFTIASRKIEIRKAVLNQADIRFSVDDEGDINIKFIIDRLSSNDTTASGGKQWFFGIKSVALNDCKFSMTNTGTFDRPFGLNYSDIKVSDLNLIVSDFRLGETDEGGVRFRIRKLACTEQSGVTIDFFSADFFVNRNNLSFKNLRIVSTGTDLTANDASFHFDTFKDFGGGDFPVKVWMSIDLEPSEVAFEDLSYFVPVFRQYPNAASVSGKVTGTVENLRGENIRLRVGKRSYLHGNFDLKGLPNLRSTYIYADFSELTTCPEDIESIKVAKSRTGHVNLPETMRKLTTIGFKGNFTGFFDDFATYGTFTTNLGNLSTDISIKPVTSTSIDTTFTYHGKLKTDKFDLGKLLSQSSIGKVTMSGMIDGSASGRGNIHASIEGLIKNIYLRGYDYQNISINGAVNNRMYDGQLVIDEPNLKMDFSGKVDLTNPIPEYDFWANVERAKLHNLKLVETDTSSFAAFSIKAVFSGTNIDNLMGELELKNSLLRRNGREIEINDLLLFTKAIRDTNRFILRSDILDAEIWGQYQFLKLPQSFLSLVKNYAPAWVSTTTSADSLSHNNFRFEAEFKNTEKLTNFFVNEFHVSRRTRLEGIYNPAQKEVHFVLNVPYMNLDGRRWHDFYVTGNTEDSVFVIESGSRIFKVNDNMVFDNLTFIAQARGDSVNLDLRWNNWDTVLNKGNLSSKVFFLNRPKQKIPSIHIFSSPGQIVMGGDAWNITHQGISVDTSSIRINSFRAAKDEQEILISGLISRREEDKLLINIANLNLSMLNSSTQFDKLMFGGVANGSATLSNLYGIPVFVSKLHVDDFSLNDGLFGSTDLTASWNSFNRSVRVEMESLLDDVRTLYIRGNYFISSSNLDFDVNVEKVPIKIFQSYIDAVFTGLEGTLSSRLKLTGTLDKLMLNGEIDLRRAALTLDYTKTRYNFSGSTVVKDNVVQFKDIQIFDRFGNMSKANGTIATSDFKDINFDLNLSAQNFEVLNTRERDNDLFYGKAFASGNIRISGSTTDLRIDVKARTGENTQLNIPLSANSEVSRTTFISFVDHTPRAQRRVYDLARRRRQSVNDEPDAAPERKFAMNLLLDITPSAEVQLIFDAKIGDIMRAKGNGNLDINIGNNKFDMSGTYTVEEGDYLFTLKNVINKKFVIEKGGIITWNGNPMDALLNLKAIYHAKPSLRDLVGDLNENAQSARRNINTECILHISNKLTDPNIRFEISLPPSEQEARSYLSAITNSDEEMTRQFLSLLVMNRFYPNPNQASGSSGTGVESMGLATASEFLTNQLSYMISQWSSAFDIDFSYRPGSDMSRQNLGVDLSTNLWSIHMDAEVGDNKNVNNLETANSGLVDFTFDIRLNKSGKLRFKAFNRPNENSLYNQNSLYTQGIGLLYREDFNHLKELFTKKQAPVRREEDDEVIENKAPEEDKPQKPDTAAQ